MGDHTKQAKWSSQPVNFLGARPFMKLQPLLICSCWFPHCCPPLYRFFNESSLPAKKLNRILKGTADPKVFQIFLCSFHRSISSRKLVLTTGGGQTCSNTGCDMVVSWLWVIQCTVICHSAIESEVKLRRRYSRKLLLIQVEIIALWKSYVRSLKITDLKSLKEISTEWKFSEGGLRYSSMLPENFDTFTLCHLAL